MSKTTVEMLIAGKLFTCERRANQILQKYFISVKKQLATNEDAEVILEDLEQAVHDKLVQALGKKQKIVTATAARYVVESVGLPESSEAPVVSETISLKQKEALVVLAAVVGISVLFWCVPVIFRFLWQIEAINGFAIEATSRIYAYFFGMMPPDTVIAIGLSYIAVALAVLAFSVINWRRGLLSKKYKLVRTLLIATIALCLVTLAGTVTLKMYKYEQISVSNPINNFDFSGCGKAISIGSVIQQGQQGVLFEDAIRNGWVYVGKISGDINKEALPGFYSDAISCQKLSELQTQNPNKEYLILDIKEGKNGQIFEGGEFSRAGTPESYFALFVR